MVRNQSAVLKLIVDRLNTIHNIVVVLNITLELPFSFTKFMQCTEYSKIWLNLTFAALSLTFIRGHKVFPVFMADRVIYQVTLWSRSTFQNLESTMWLAKLGKGMLFLVEQAFVRRDVTQAPLKTPADVGGYMQCKFQKIINSLCKSLTAVASQGKVKNFAHPIWWCWLTVNMCCFKVDL